MFEYLHKALSDTFVVVVSQTADEDGNTLLFFLWFWCRNVFRVTVEEAGFHHGWDEPSLFHHRDGKSCLETSSFLIFCQSTGFEHKAELHNNIHHFTVFQQEEDDLFEPCDAIFLCNIGTYLFNDHICRQRVWTYFSTGSTEKTALKDIFGIFIQRQMSFLVGTQQVNKPTR